MTKEQALKELEDCRTGKGFMDAEGTHSHADDVLCEFLKHLGHNDIVDAWEAVQPKWYA